MKRGWTIGVAAVLATAGLAGTWMAYSASRTQETRTAKPASAALFGGVVPETIPAATQPETMPATRREFLKPRNDLPGLPNFAQVSEDLYRGAQPTAEGMAQLKKMGIKTVVNLRWLHSDRDELKGTGLGYVEIEAKAWHPEDEDIVRFLKVVQDPANRPVFVHCQHGADRTGCAVAAYRIVVQGWMPGEAAQELPNFGFHPIFSQIRDYLARFDRTAILRQMDKAKPVRPEVVK